VRTPEAAVKKRVTEILKAHGAYYFSPVTSGFGRSGVPDIVACIRGRFIAIECKAGKNKPTALQQKNLQEIREVKGLAFVVNEESIVAFAKILEVLCGEE
jgi:Holliday junction resolvase